jgi:hypothetical protein
MIERLKCWERWITIFVSALALTGSCIAAVWAASADRSNVIAEQAAQSVVLGDHESRVRELERQIPVVATNVETILASCRRLEQRVDLHYATEPGRRMPVNPDDTRP